MSQRGSAHGPRETGGTTHFPEVWETKPAAHPRDGNADCHGQRMTLRHVRARASAGLAELETVGLVSASCRVVCSSVAPPQERPGLLNWTELSHFGRPPYTPRPSARA